MDDGLSKPVIADSVHGMPPPPAADVLDATVLGELQVPGLEGLLAELIGLFSEEAPRNLDRMRAALCSGNAAELARVAHALKGSAATLGARTMVATCLELETGGHAGRTVELAPALARLEAQTDEVVRALAALAAGTHTAASEVGATVRP
jgi:HPt (histidine-containing phosphotransfer) domain-containing protein